MIQPAQQVKGIIFDLDVILRATAEQNAEVISEDGIQEVSDTLAILKRRGYRMVAVNSNAGNQQKLLKLGLADLFDNIMNRTDDARLKSESEIILKAAESMGLPPTLCHIVGDAATGFEAGDTTGCTTIAFGNTVQEHFGNQHIESFRELLEIL